MLQKIEPILGLNNNANLRTGIELIDAQHATLIERLSDLQQHLLSDENLKDAKEDALFLATYSIEHFTEEERFMAEFNYEGFVAHRNEHRRFEEWVEQVKARLAEGGDHRIILEEVHAFLAEWLFNHIRDVDLEMARAFARR